MYHRIGITEPTVETKVKPENKSRAKKQSSCSWCQNLEVLHLMYMFASLGQLADLHICVPLSLWYAM